MKNILLLITLFFSMTVVAQAAILFEDDFDGYADTPLNHGWGYLGSSVSVPATEGMNGSRCLKVTYASTGTAPHSIQKGLAEYNLQEVYVRFNFKVGPNPSGGAKFLKFFGANSGDGVANTTFMLNYNRNTLYEISYGAGNAGNNDTQQIIRYNGGLSSTSAANDTNIVRHVTNDPFDPKDGQWHSFEVFIRYNSDGQRDGEYKIWIDNTLWVHASNVRNRHELNTAKFSQFRLGDYTSQYINTTWDLWYDNVVVSTTHIGGDGGDSQAPTLAEVTAVTTPTSDNTPNYTFSSSKAGTITYDGDCSSSTTSAISGNNTITLETLIDGTYSDCTITVTDSSDNISTPLSINTFTITTSSSAIRADVDGQAGITLTDVSLTLRNSLGLDMSMTNWQPSTTTGDVNCDGVSNSTDALLILRDSLDLDMSGTGWCTN